MRRAYDTAVVLSVACVIAFSVIVPWAIDEARKARRS